VKLTDTMISSVVQATNTSAPGATGRLTLRLVCDSGEVLWTTDATISGGQTATIPVQGVGSSDQGTSNIYCALSTEFKLEAQATGEGMVVDRSHLSIIAILIGQRS
jgi:hypothetical protein